MFKIYLSFHNNNKIERFLKDFIHRVCINNDLKVVKMNQENTHSNLGRIGRNLAFAIVLVFSFFGMVVFGIIVHEYSHYSDYKGEVTKSELALVLPQSFSELSNFNAGYFKFSYSSENKDKIQEIAQTTEAKAYLINILVFLVFDICLLAVIINQVRQSRRER